MNYGLVVWRRKWIVLAIVVVCTTSAYLFADSKPRIYQATAVLAYQQPPSIGSIMIGGSSVDPVVAELATYTRTLFLVIFVGVVFGLVAREFGRPDAARITRRIAGIAAVALMLALVLLAAAPVQSRYFGLRFEEAPSGRIADWSLRASRFWLIEKTVAHSDLPFGVGYPSPAPPAAESAYKWSADMDWVAVLYRLGLAGIALFGLMFVGFGARAYRRFRARSGRASYLALVYLITLLLMLVSSFEQWTFMFPLVFPMGLWLFAFMAAETLRQMRTRGELGVPSVSESKNGDAVA